MALGCRCGQVRGSIAPAEPRAVNRVVCYCDDCQAFAHWLGRPDLLHAKGGSDIVQLAPGSMTLTQGQEKVAGVRLEPGGLFRADTVLAKHDESYMPREVADALKAQGRWQEGAGKDAKAAPKAAADSTLGPRSER